MSSRLGGAYGASDDTVDYILGITFEIWEQRQIDLIHQYYATDCIVWGLDGITRGVEAVVAGTTQTLDAFPDRLLIAEDVIVSKDPDGSAYSSHRLHSTATNTADTVFGPATNGRIRMTNIADCVVEDGIITREWLVRDNLTLALQLGADPRRAAADMAERRTAEHRQWLNDEISRVGTADGDVVSCAATSTESADFATNVLTGLWAGTRATTNDHYASYCVLHRAPMTHVSGREAIAQHYQTLRSAFSHVRASVDHLATQPHHSNQRDIAVRWSVTGEHTGSFHGIEATGKPVTLLGVSHWRTLGGRIVMEHTVFDELALLSQLLER
ncbi:MAG: ester cyclase [Pseudomonadota bacterium]